MRANTWLKRIDRYFGIPLLALLSLSHFRRQLPKNPQRIGVLKEAAIGDTVILAAALHDLRAHYPHAKIILFAGASNAAFARLLAVPDQVVLIPINNPQQAMRLLRQQKLDLLFDFGQWPRINSLLSFFSGAKYTIGFKTPNQYRHYAYDQAIEHRRDVHELENFRGLVNQSGFTAPAQFEIKIRPYKLLTNKPSAVLHLWPGGERSELKEWPQSHWIALAQELHQRGFSIVLTGAPADAQKNLAFAALLPGIEIHQCAGLPIADIPALLQASRLVISVNTGIMHLAAVLGVPTIGLHGPTSAKRWGPYGARAAAVVSTAKHSQYLHLGFEYPRECTAMEKLAVVDVLAALDKVLS